MPSSTFAAVLGIAAVARAQQVGSYQTEAHPSLSWQACTARNSCTTRSGRVVIDANWRWVHSTSGYNNCYTGNAWDTSLCQNDVTCAQNCALEGADYSGTYGVTTSGNSMALRFVTQSANRNVGSRLYLMETDDRYQMLNLLGQEISFDVDTSQLPCGLNGAVYLVSMDADGGMSRYSGNRAGARYGTGYCDSQCPRDLKFINGQGNSEGWQPSSNDPNAGVGNHGSCCAEMDIWEANSISAAYTPHPCSNSAQHMCQGDACGGTYSSTRYAGDCDPDGCDFNSYRQGNTTFYGPGRTVDTNSRFTVVTQFITSDGSTTGTLSEIRRFYVQNGRLIPNSQSTISGVTGNSITTNYCNAQKTAFNDGNYFSQRGGMAGMGNALRNGMVLVMSIWDDHYANMLWLDSNYPLTRSASFPGVARGTCPTTSGVPSDVEATFPNAQVIYSNIRTGPINSTFTAT